MSTTTAADRAGRAGSSDPLGSIGWTERTGGVLTVRECVTLQTGAQGDYACAPNRPGFQCGTPSILMTLPVSVTT
jgi:hypothetical protein